MTSNPPPIIWFPLLFALDKALSASTCTDPDLLQLWSFIAWKLKNQNLIQNTIIFYKFIIIIIINFPK